MLSKTVDKSIFFVYNGITETERGFDMQVKSNIPTEYRGSGNKKKYYASEQLIRKVVAEIDRATTMSGLKDMQVAEMLGLTKQAYSRIKNQKGSLSMGNVEAIAEALDYDVEVKFVKRSEQK